MEAAGCQHILLRAGILREHKYEPYMWSTMGEDRDAESAVLVPSTYQRYNHRSYLFTHIHRHVTILVLLAFI